MAGRRPPPPPTSSSSPPLPSSSLPATAAVAGIGRRRLPWGAPVPPAGAGAWGEHGPVFPAAASSPAFVAVAEHVDPPPPAGLPTSGGLDPPPAASDPLLAASGGLAPPLATSAGLPASSAPPAASSMGAAAAAEAAAASAAARASLPLPLRPPASLHSVWAGPGWGALDLGAGWGPFGSVYTAGPSSSPAFVAIGDPPATDPALTAPLSVSRDSGRDGGQVFHEPSAGAALAAALRAAKAEAAAAQERARAAAIALERERAGADALARRVAEAERYLYGAPELPLPQDSAAASPPGGRGPKHPGPGSGRPRPEVFLLQPLAGLGPLTLHRYALDDHVLLDTPAADRDPAWQRLDIIVLSWIFGTLSLDLQDIVRAPEGTARQTWQALEGQFLGNAEARALQLDAAFRTFEQGDLSVGEYCRRMKGMADALCDLGWPMEDRFLVLNIVRGLNDSYGHLKTWISKQKPFPSFLQIRDDLVLDEITRGFSKGSSSTVLVAATPAAPTSSAPPVAPPAPATPPAHSLLGAPPPGPSGGGGGRGGRCRRSGRGGASRGSTSTPAPTPAAAGGAPWPSFSNPWSGRISMWPFQAPGGVLALSTSHRLCSLALLLLRRRRPGSHLLSLLWPGLLDGTRIWLPGVHFSDVIALGPFTPSDRIFDLVHCDLWTSPVLSISGYKYYLVVVDDFSHYSWTFSLRFKSEAFSTLSHFFAWVSTQFGLTIKAVQCDNGREFDNNASRSFFLTRGVQLRMSCPYTSAQNGKAERMIRTTNDVMRTLLFQASLPARFWAESLHTATYLLNRLPSTASPAPTPHHALFGTPPRYDHLRVFGCAC
ncbi:hypothetical protein U9M48_034514 [Paspalum notatum var. saurae]|uniref:Integrase catalytic domain-containing protein n=1 Tax=Paspalum notatum var. saurae TaxID=547442 RepID=A0AAQ3X7I0_PASNO